MKSDKRMLVAGGDMRQLYCALRLSEKYETYIIGFDSKYTAHFPQLGKADLSDKFSRIILPVPPLDGCGMINCPCCAESLSTDNAAEMLSPDGTVFAGKIDCSLREIFPRAELIDYMSREELSLFNAIPTAEGAVQIALEELPVTLNGLKVLVVGCGRIGTALIHILKGFGADITVAVRNQSGFAKAKMLGIKACLTDDMPDDSGLVFNTVPSLIFSRGRLMNSDKNTLYIDLASKPGGFDFSAAAELGIKVIWALGLPGRTAPITSGEMIAETIDGILTERGENNEI